MSSDMVVVATAIGVLVFTICWAAIVAWCAWKLGGPKK